MRKYRRRKCRCCRAWFMPQPHNAYHQRYCAQPECRRASKRMSQRRWFRKNRDHFRGPVNVDRVNEWRLLNPGHGAGRRRFHRLELRVYRWRERFQRRIRLRIDDPQSGALQDLSFSQPACIREVSLTLNRTLQDFIGNSPVCCYI